MIFDEYSFADLLSNIVDNRGKTCPVEDKGFPLIATNCIKEDSLYPVFEKIRYVSDDTYKNWFRSHPIAGDIIFVCKGSPGRVAWVKDPVSFCIAQDMVAIRADQRKIDPKFLFALLSSAQSVNKINNMHVGTLIPHFKKGDFKNLFFSIPGNLNVQRGIGSFYFSLSEKIESNKEINKTLEQMAQTLFKSWFVDFDPVKAKIAVLEAGGSQEEATLAAMTAISGKDADALVVFERQYPEQYAELKTTAERFPSVMLESELGAIPARWEIGHVKDVAEKIFSGGTPTTTKTEYWNGDYNWFSSGETRSTFITNTEKTITLLGIEQSSTKKSTSGDILIASAGQGHTRGQTSLNMIDAFINQSVVAVRAKKASMISWLFLNLRSRYEEMRSISDSHSSRGSLTTKLISGMSVIIPDENILNRFEDRISSSFKLISCKQTEIESLKQLRDTLLPKLLSGEITLPEAEQAVSEAENV